MVEIEKVLSNISTSYGMLGHPEPVVELLLHTISSLKDKKNTFSHKIQPSRWALHCNNQSNILQRKIDMLWQLYHAATLVGDWETCFHSINELCRTSCCSVCISISNMFTKLEMGRGLRLEALNLCHKSIVLESPFSSECIDPKLYSIAVNMWRVDSEVHSEKGTVKDNSQITCQTSKIIELIKELKQSYSESTEASQLLSALEGYALNNHAVGLILCGKNFESLPFFLRAINSFKDITFELNTKEERLYPFFNIVIVLWRQGYRKEAIDLWITERCLKRSSNDLNKARMVQRRNISVTRGDINQRRNADVCLGYDSLDVQMLEYALNMH